VKRPLDLGFVALASSGRAKRRRESMLGISCATDPPPGTNGNTGDSWTRVALMTRGSRFHVKPTHSDLSYIEGLDSHLGHARAVLSLSARSQEH
jgi:hypothetical protein